MNLLDTLFITRDGEPEAGRVPPIVTVHGGVATNDDLLFAHQVYDQFVQVLRHSLAATHSTDETAPNGTRVEIISSYGLDRVAIHPGGAAREELPHGIVVVVPWAPPLIYAKTKDGWKTTVVAPQAMSPIVAYNAVEFMDGDRFEIRPLVSNSGVFWDYRRSAGPEHSPSQTLMPVAIRPDGVNTTVFELPHYVIEGTIYNGDDVVRSLGSIPHILLSEEDALTHLPADTSTAAQHLAMNAYRSAAISGGVYQYRIRHERLKRAADVDLQPVYALDGSGTTDVFVTRTANNSSPFFNLLRDDLTDEGGVPLDPPLKDYNYYTYATDEVGNYGTRVHQSESVTYWAPAIPFHYRWGGQRHSGSPGQHAQVIKHAMTLHIKRRSDAEQTLNTVALALPSDLYVVPLTRRYGYPVSEYRRAGWKKKVFRHWEKFGDSYPTRYVIESEMTIDRRDVVIRQPCEAFAAFDLEWTSFDLFKTSGYGSVEGNKHIDRGNGLHNIDDEFATSMTRSPQVSIFADYSSNFQGTYPWSESFGFVMAAAGEGGRMTGEINADIARAIPWMKKLSELKCSNQVEYAYTSRHIIDYDHRSQFYVALVVVVSCSGLVREDEVALRGWLITKTDPTYTVTISVESKTRDRPLITRQLFTTSAQRPGFELLKLYRDNVFLWGTPQELDFPTIVLLPPQLAVPEGSIGQVFNLVRHQGVNSRYASEYVPESAAAPKSETGIEWSHTRGHVVFPHQAYPPGSLYARTFKLSDFPDAMWLIGATKCDAYKDDNYINGVMYYYMPALGAFISNETIHVEIRDGDFVTWTDDIEQADGYPARPAVNARSDVQLFRV